MLDKTSDNMNFLQKMRGLKNAERAFVQETNHKAPDLVTDQI